MHANIEPFRKQYESLNEIFANLDQEPDLICLTELRVKSEQFRADRIQSAPHQSLQNRWRCWCLYF